MLNFEKIIRKLPPLVRDRVDAALEIAGLFGEMRNPRVLASLAPSGVRGLLLHRGKQGVPTYTAAHHRTHFEWTYPNDMPEMRELYERAKEGQWNAATAVDWTTSVDPLDSEVPILPERLFDFDLLAKEGVRLDEKERRQLGFSMSAWMLSQFLHGEQGALLAAAQVTEAVRFFDGKLYGSTQVVDEGRHVEVFHRYINDKLGKLYQVNDNLFTIIDALMTDGRWDLKFLGMQIMVEGLALGAFGLIYKITKEPLLKSIVRLTIQDEARHVHYGVLALRDHITKELGERERREREEWAFEVALLMRNRFMAYEVYDEWFAGGRLPRSVWRSAMLNGPGMREFRTVMFSRLVPNLRTIGLMSPRILPAYEKAGLMQYYDGVAADKLTADMMLRDLEEPAAAPLQYATA